MQRILKIGFTSFGIGCVLLGLGTLALADVYEVSTEADWNADREDGGWNYPKGVVKITDEGNVELVRVHKNIDAIANAGQFEQVSLETKNPVPGGIKDAGSNRVDAEKAIDGTLDTWWSPRWSDSSQDWWIEVNLARMVSATRLKITFAATEKPFEQFSVYVSDGARIYSGSDIKEFTLVDKTTKPNTEYVLDYDLTGGGWELADDSTATSAGYAMTSQPIQFIRFVADSEARGAGIAEIELEAVGDNLALGTIERGGYWVRGFNENSNNLIFDGDYGTRWQLKILTDYDWEEGGAWFTWDLGALFWLDRIHIMGAKTAHAATTGQSDVEGYIMRTSEGARTADGALDYQDLIDVSNRITPVRYNFRHEFPLRPVRYIFWRVAHGTGNKRSRSGGGANIFEMQLFGEGYPAGAVMESGLIDLGKMAGDNQSKNITSIEWDADTPPGTAIQIQTTTGDLLREVAHYFDAGGKEISKEKWEKTPATRRGPKTIEVQPGDDWSTFSPVYAQSGARFLSPSPRRYVMFRVKLTSADPEASVSLHAIRLHYHNPLLKRVTGAVTPRGEEAQVAPDIDTQFTYRIWSGYQAGDRGYDLLMLRVPSKVDPGTVRTKIGEATVVPERVEATGDSLLIQFSQRVLRDSVEVTFVARIRENSTVVEGYISDSTMEGIWQGIDPERQCATTVMVSKLAESADLVGNVTIFPRTLTPNGDGVNDEMEVQLSVFKVDSVPEVCLYDLKGNFVSQLKRKEGGDYVYGWNGKDGEGELVAPGVYICRISVDADAGNSAYSQSVTVVY